MRLDGKVALVTGAGRGNGAAIALGYLREGAMVALTDLDLKGVKARVAEAGEYAARALALPLDVTDLNSIQSCVENVLEAFGRLDVLVNNAGIIIRNHFLDLTESDWDAVMTVNAKGTFLCSQAVARVMAKRGGGSIINISSFSERIALPNTASYGASKGAVSALTRHMALDLSPYRIRVNAIAPGVILTDMNRERLSDPEQLRSTLERLLVDRLGNPADLVGAAVLLASDESAYITGTTIFVDGGWLVR